MNYDKYSFLYPPRPEAKISPADILKYDTGEYIACPKYDGSSTLIFLDGKGGVIIRNRHNEEKTKAGAIDFAGLHHGKGWMVICGELLDKAKRDEHGLPLKGYAIWDVLVYSGSYLLGSTFRERLDLMESLWPCQRMATGPSGVLKEYNHLCFTDVPQVYKAPAYGGYFGGLYEDLVKTQLYEGLVLKKMDGKLEPGYRESNNTHWQLKVRRATKNYVH